MAKAGHTPSFAVDDPKLADVVANSLQVLAQTHALGDLVADAPEVDNVAA